MRKIVWFFLLLVFLLHPSSVFASSNNKFGIHVTHKEDLSLAADLVNSNGGDWGYITVVIPENDQSKEKWQEFFNLCREKHLIPLVRIATQLDEGVWVKPGEDSFARWVDFLSSLNWPTKVRYVIIFNEPNHSKEWGGEVNPKEYAKILDRTISVFKQKSPDFFILNAGFDQVAPNSSETMDEIRFLEQMNFEVPGIFSKLDGWVSHSYPNHGFVGKPWEVGRGTVDGYEWELAILANLGLKRDLPVFITETGWPHWVTEDGKWKIENKFYDAETAAEYMKQAFENVWLPDNKLIAVTPFILNYPFFPFENFSWIDKEKKPYSQFYEVKNLSKIKGEPVQEEKYEIVSFPFIPFLPENFLFQGKITLKNTGQSIWGERPFILPSKAYGSIRVSNIVLPNKILVKPDEKWTFDFTLETFKNDGEFSFSWQGLPEYKVTVFKNLFEIILQKISSFLPLN